MAIVNNITQRLQDELKSMMITCCYLCKESDDIYDLYWHTDANTTIGAVTNATDPVTSSTTLTKNEFTNGIALCENFKKMCKNEAVSTADYLSYAHNIYYGTATATELDSLIEAIGDRLKNVAGKIISLYSAYKVVNELYTENEVVDIVAVLDTERVIFGASMTNSDLGSAMTFLTQFANFCNGSAVTQANYAATIAKWNTY